MFLWEPTLSPHKLDLFRALGAHPRVVSCTYVSQQGLSEERRALGWTVGALDGLDIRIDPPANAIDALVAGATGPNAVHLFSGMHGPPVIAAGIAAAIRNGARFALMSEPRSSEGGRGVLRFAHSWATERLLRAHADFVLAIGRNGPTWFARTGYRRDRIFPFAYFLPARPPSTTPRALNASPRLAYLGRLTAAKGVGLLLDSLPLLPPDLRIEIAGLGPEVDRVEGVAAMSSGRVTYHGPLSMAAVPDFLARADILAQPSLTSDGWGAVVSEALLAGAAAVATVKVGASILLDDPVRGRVMACPEPRLLADAVASLVAGDALEAPYRAARQAWARACLTGEAGANYLIDILSHRFEGGPVPAPFYS